MKNKEEIDSYLGLSISWVVYVYSSDYSTH